MPLYEALLVVLHDEIIWFRLNQLGVANEIQALIVKQLEEKESEGKSND